MPVVANGPAPYPPSGKVIDLVERHRAQGLPTPINVDKVARLTGTPGLAPRVMKALLLLDLVDGEGMPTATFDEMAKAPTDGEFKERFAEMLKAAYADVFQYLDPSTATYEQIEGQFRNYTPRGQLDRMVALFKGLCEYTSIMSPGSASVGAKARKPTGEKTPNDKVKLPPGDAPKRKPKTSTQTEPPVIGRPVADAKSRYIDLLLAKAEAEPSDELFDRIEKVIGIDAGSKGGGSDP